MTHAFDTSDNQLRAIRRGGSEVVPEAELLDKLARSRRDGRPLRIKLGIDPTAPDIHLGNAVPLWKLRQFQELGHVAVLIIGDFTARIGDPSGRNAMRPPLDAATIDANAATYLAQVHQILLPERCEIRRNSEWLSTLGFADVVKLTSRMTVAQMLVRDDFAKRFAEQTPISIHEFLYPLMQGWDSVVVRADVELGGTDQRFNLLVGRSLQAEEGQEPQSILVNPLVPGTDGVKKMSKSTGNYIGITESPEQQFGKTMSIPDGLMPQWFASFTEVSEARIAELLAGHPRIAKEALGKAIVERYHGASAAEAAAEAFRRVFAKGDVPDEVREVVLTTPRTLAEVVVDEGFALSKGKARDLIRQGAVRVNRRKVLDATTRLPFPEDVLLEVGGQKRCVLIRADSVDSAMSESDARELILRLLCQSPGGSASLSDLMVLVPGATALSEFDRRPSATRLNEERWQQILRNAASSHRDSAQSIFSRGLATATGDRLQITAAGIAHVRSTERP